MLHRAGSGDHRCPAAAAAAAAPGLLLGTPYYCRCYCRCYCRGLVHSGCSCARGEWVSGLEGGRERAREGFFLLFFEGQGLGVRSRQGKQRVCRQWCVCVCMGGGVQGGVCVGMWTCVRMRGHVYEWRVWRREGVTECAPQSPPTQPTWLIHQPDLLAVLLWCLGSGCEDLRQSQPFCGVCS